MISKDLCHTPKEVHILINGRTFKYEAPLYFNWFTWNLFILGLEKESLRPKKIN